MAKAARTLSLHAACTHSLSVGVFSHGELSRKRSRVRVPSSPPFIPKQLVHYWKIGAIRKKIQIERHPLRPVSFLFRQNHFHYFALRPPLLAAETVAWGPPLYIP